MRPGSRSVCWPPRCSSFTSGRWIVPNQAYGRSPHEHPVPPDRGLAGFTAFGIGHRNPAMRRDTLTLQARYVFPVEGPPIEDGVVTLQEGRIGWVGPSRERAGDLDLGNVAIVPGSSTPTRISSLRASTTEQRCRDPDGTEDAVGLAPPGRGPAAGRLGADAQGGGRREPERLHRGRHHLPGRHHDRRAELGPGGRRPRSAPWSSPS